MKMRNPLFKRIPKEIVSDWRKYLVIIVFMVVMIGVISGMYVGHDSMMFSVEESREKLHIEDGSFELSKKANEELLTSIATGEKANVRQFFIDKGMKKADRQVAKE
jgi:putative ABC transport system permease protein